MNYRAWKSNSESGFILLPTLAVILLISVYLTSQLSIALANTQLTRIQSQSIQERFKGSPELLPESNELYLSQGWLVKNKSKLLEPSWAKLVKSPGRIDSETPIELLSANSPRFYSFKSLHIKTLEVNKSRLEIIALGDIRIENIIGTTKHLFLYSHLGEIYLPEVNKPCGELGLAKYERENDSERNIRGCLISLDSSFWPEALVLGQV